MATIKEYTHIKKLPPPPPWMLQECNDYDVEDDLPIIFEGHKNKMKMNEEFKKLDFFTDKDPYGNPRFKLPLRYIYLYDLRWEKYHHDPHEYPLNDYKKYVAINLPINKAHKRYGNNNWRYRDEYDLHLNHYTIRESLLKADVYKWCKMNNLPVKKSTHIEEMVKLLWNM